MLRIGEQLPSYRAVPYIKFPVMSLHHVYIIGPLYEMPCISMHIFYRLLCLSSYIYSRLVSNVHAPFSSLYMPRTLHYH